MAYVRIPHRYVIRESIFPARQEFLSERDVLEAPQEQNGSVPQRPTFRPERFEPFALADDGARKHPRALARTWRREGLGEVPARGARELLPVADRERDQNPRKEIEVPAEETPDGAAHKAAEPLEHPYAPHGPEPAVVGDDPLDVAGVVERVGHADGPAPVVHHECYVLQAERFDEARQVLGVELWQIRDVVGLVGQAEAKIIRRDAPELRCELLPRAFIHVMHVPVGSFKEPRLERVLGAVDPRG